MSLCCTLHHSQMLLHRLIHFCHLQWKLGYSLFVIYKLRNVCDTFLTKIIILPKIVLVNLSFSLRKRCVYPSFPSGYASFTIFACSCSFIKIFVKLHRKGAVLVWKRSLLKISKAIKVLLV